MSAYLGNLGQLVPIKCSAQPVARAERYSFDTTLEGRRKAQVIGHTPREWEVSFTIAERAQNAALFAFADGEWGIGPFVWVSPEAQVTNMLTPAAASCDPSAISDPSSANFNSTVSAGGPLYLGEGVYAGRSWVNSDPTAAMFFGPTRVPVIPGQKVTGSAYLRGAGGVARLTFYDATNTVMGSPVISTVQSTAGNTVRSYVTATVPDGAVGALVSADDATQAARPALTWTDGLVPYGMGGGCPKAVIDGLSRTPSLITPGAYLASSSFTVREVG